MANNVRMIDIAKKAEVSLATVGKVLQGTGGKNVRVSQETASRVREIARKFNYKPNLVARQLAIKKSYTIGVLIDAQPLPQNSIRLAEMGSRARQRGYHLMTLFEQAEPTLVNECLEEFRGRGVDGMICMHHVYPGQPELVPNLICESGIENVVFIDEPAIPNASFIGSDYMELGRNMVEYMLSKGYKKIALAINDLDWYTGPRVYRGYMEALVEHGMSPDKKLVWIGTENKPQGKDPHKIDEAVAKRIIKDLVVDQKAYAIMTVEDYWAVQLINTLKDQGYSVPKDVGIVSAGNRDISEFVRPKLTVADLQYRQVARGAIDMLIDMIENNENNGHKTDEERIFVPPKIIPGDSA